MTRAPHHTTRTRRAGRRTRGPDLRGASDAQQAVAVLLIVALGVVAAAALQYL